MKFPNKQVMPRYTFMAIVFTCMGISILVKAGYTMTLKRDYWLEVGKRTQRSGKTLAPTRGNILADNSELLASSIPEYKLFMDFMSWEKDSTRRATEQFSRDSMLTVHLDTISLLMHNIFPDIDPKAFKENMLEGRRRKSHHWKIYPKRISYIQYRKVKEIPLFNLPANRGGLHTENFMTRKNPYGSLATRTIGDLFKGKDSARCGIELSFDSLLRGKPGRYHMQKELGSQIKVIDLPAENGYDVQLTINVKMQDICEKALRDKLEEINAEHGICILMEVATGDIKAMCSLSRMEDGRYAEIQNLAVSNSMEPGSVFKPVSFLVALNDGEITLENTVNTGSGIREMHGRKMKDHNWRRGGYGLIDVPNIIGKSSNVGVSVLIDSKYGNNPARFVDGVYKTGIHDDLHLPLTGYAKPYIPRPDNPNWKKATNWSATTLPWMSIGYATRIPPISTLTFYNGIANFGRMMQPRLVKALWHNGEIIKEYEPVVMREQMASRKAVDDIRTCLKAVTTKGVGVGHMANSPLIDAAGKTGTAQIWDKSGNTGKYIVSFAGFFPFAKPKYSCIVCIRKPAPASGGGQCGPVFRRVAESVMALESQQSYSEARDTVKTRQPRIFAGNGQTTAQAARKLGVKLAGPVFADNPAWLAGDDDSECGLRPDNSRNDCMPDLTGYSLRDAVFRLERMGLRVKAEGAGRVSRQSVAAGQRIQKGQTVQITLQPGNNSRQG